MEELPVGMDGLSPNPFGFVDHAAFAGLGVDLVWGVDDNGDVVHINAARRGLKCRLSCPACKARLIARKGTKKAAHFAHQGLNSGCGSGRETNAHFWAKQLLIKRKRIWTPVVTAVVDGISREESAARWMEFSDVRSERRLERIVPDIVLILADGRELIVEICVTHPCGEDKIALIQSRGWPAIEINLRQLRTCQDMTAIERGLLREAPRKWLCNPRRDRAEERLRAELAAAAARRASALQRRAAQEADRKRREAAAIEAAGRDLLDAVAVARRHVRPVADSALAQLIANDGGELIGISDAGAGWSVTREEWQASLLEQFVVVSDPRTFEDRTFSLDSTIDYLEPLIAPSFVEPPNASIHAWVRRHHPEIRLPREAVEDYLEALCMAGALQSEGSGVYGLPEDISQELKREQRRLLEIDRRTETAHTLIDEMLADLPIAETVDFEPQDWLKRALPGDVHSPDDLLVAGGTPCSDLMTTLRALAAMVAGGEEAVDDLLDLPLEGARYRAIERGTARRAREAADRVERLRSVATRTLAAEAASWLLTPLEGSDDTPLALGSRAEAGLNLCIAALARIGKRREADRAEAVAIAARREKLSVAVAKLYPTELREFAVRNHATALGCSPWEACGTDHGLDLAIRTLTLQAGGRRRR
ncbi:hypothetical protein FSB78_18355 [Sphingomonas ginsenosidivorax]|uniref:Competence protein CoiA-like N-terminal domain-containing protein n=1 Tax=Sphingomonas ginsenosidivorax TaxID=862135 RepID=A0A5C6U4S1_9SPHN|nr:competence protein CoiA family protein [Sphingomonas ginsenosidivorax]TXC67953.1 hypothetical protein FSB78_18355 [Sphingomonas ginsenosidivorax]